MVSETIQEIEVGGIRWRYVSWDEWPPTLSQYFESSDTWAPVAHGAEATVLWDALNAALEAYRALVTG